MDSNAIFSRRSLTPPPPPTLPFTAIQQGITFGAKMPVSWERAKPIALSK